MRSILFAGLLIVVGCSPSKQTGGEDMQVPDEIEAQMDEAMEGAEEMMEEVEEVVEEVLPDTIG